MKTWLVLLGLLFFLLIGFGFMPENPFLKIGEKDVELAIPNYFPKPVYDFSKNKITPEGFTLGRKLFYDPILSQDYFISCASCHQQFAAFAHIDHALAHGIYGRIGKRNVPALQNLIWNETFMADGGVTHLDLQPIAPITNPLEMDESIKQVIGKLQKDSVYPKLFYNAFKDSMITTEKIMKSFSQFLGLMISADSKYDRFRNGKEQLNEEELKGLKLFRMNCVGCHTEPLFTNHTFQVNGLPLDTALLDSGRMKITGKREDFLKFRVPGLRNVEMTYPYMHDGRFKKLADVIKSYADGSQSAKNPLLKQIRLNEQQQKDLLAFLLTLTDKTFLHDRKFMDPGRN